MSKVFSILHRGLLLVALTLALITAGSMARVPSADDAAMMAYQLAGGTVADLCADDGDGVADHRDCPACHLTALPPIPAIAVAAQKAHLVLVATVSAPRENRTPLPVLDPARGLRAPPFV